MRLFLRKHHLQLMLFLSSESPDQSASVYPTKSEVVSLVYQILSLQNPNLVENSLSGPHMFFFRRSLIPGTQTNTKHDNCLDVATDQSGCCVIQQCLTHSVGEPLNRIIAQIISNALILSENSYGNYVVQYMLGFRIPHITFNIMMQLSGSFVSLSLNKYESNVVEQFLKQSKRDEALPIIKELASNFLRVLQDPFGNYVTQRALLVSYKEHMAAHKELMKLVSLKYTFLQSHPYGKRVLALARVKGFKLTRP